LQASGGTYSELFQRQFTTFDVSAPTKSRKHKSKGKDKQKSVEKDASAAEEEAKPAKDTHKSAEKPSKKKKKEESSDESSSADNWGFRRLAVLCNFCKLLTPRILSIITTTNRIFRLRGRLTTQVRGLDKDSPRLERNEMSFNVFIFDKWTIPS